MKWLVSYDGIDEYPFYYREGDTFYLPMIKSFNKEDILYIYFTDCSIRQICFKCLILDVNLIRDNGVYPNFIPKESLWGLVKVLAVAPVGVKSLNISMFEYFGIDESITLRISGYGMSSPKDISNSHICKYLDIQFTTNLNHIIILNKQLSWIRLLLKMNSDGSFGYAKMPCPHRCPMTPTHKSLTNESWLGELVLKGRHPAVSGHFSSYENKFKDGKVSHYNHRAMTFDYLLNYHIPHSNTFSCTIYDYNDNIANEDELSWHGSELDFYSLEHLKPFCLWLVCLNLQKLDIKDIYNLAFVGLPMSNSERDKEKSFNIINNVIESYSRSHYLLTPQIRNKIINWLYEVTRDLPCFSNQIPQTIQQIIRYFE